MIDTNPTVCQSISDVFLHDQPQAKKCPVIDRQALQSCAGTKTEQRLGNVGRTHVPPKIVQTLIDIWPCSTDIVARVVQTLIEDGLGPGLKGTINLQTGSSARVTRIGGR